MMTVVAGPCGAGKTHWIAQELAQVSTAAAYVFLGAGTLPIDATRIGLQYPQVEVIEQPSEAGLLERLEAGVELYVEVGFQLEPNLPFLQACLHRCVGVVADDQGADWRSWADEWADEVVPGNASTLDLRSAQLWRAPLSGQVFDPPSIDMFWQELVRGAYGDVHRVKGIFEMADGRAFHMDFVKGLPNQELPNQESPNQDLPKTVYTELKVPRWLEGRPQRFSGMEVVGQGLDQGAIATTLEACCLSDALLLSHQAALQNSYSQAMP